MNASSSRLHAGLTLHVLQRRPPADNTPGEVLEAKLLDLAGALLEAQAPFLVARQSRSSERHQVPCNPGYSAFRTEQKTANRMLSQSNHGVFNRIS